MCPSTLLSENTRTTKPFPKISSLRGGVVHIPVKHSSTVRDEMNGDIHRHQCQSSSDLCCNTTIANFGPNVKTCVSQQKEVGEQDTGRTTPRAPSNATPLAPARTTVGSSNSNDATRLRHTPRGPVARGHPPAVTNTRPKTIQSTSGACKSISDALLINSTQTGIAILGIGLGVSVDGKADAETETFIHGSGSKSNTSPIAKQLPCPKRLASIKPLASPPLPRDINKQPLSSMNGCSVSPATTEAEVSSKTDTNKSGAEKKTRPAVRPLPALPLPGESCNPLIGSASSSRTVTASGELFLQSTAMSNGFSPQMDNATTTAMERNKNNTTTTTVPEGTPTVSFPVPKRSVTIGVPPLSRETSIPPPLDRSLSLKVRGLTQSGARFSPSVISRPPPLPLTNLPVLSRTPSTTLAVTGHTEASREQQQQQEERRRSRLMLSMPALPLQGSSRGTRGHEEVDDMEEEDEMDMDMEDDDMDMDMDERNGQVASEESSGSSSSRIETPRSSMDTSMDSDDGNDEKGMESSATISRKSSYETARGSSPVFWDACACPDASSTITDGSESQVSLVGMKGKAKQEEVIEEAVDEAPDRSKPSGSTTPLYKRPSRSLVNVHEIEREGVGRRRSMPMNEPPSYSSVSGSNPLGRVVIAPREDEGMEKLPGYTNTIFLKAVMPRKMEFTSPGVQAKDRKWRRVWCVLEGTALRVYKYQEEKSALRQLLRPRMDGPTRVYTMQHAESGLGKDYTKRPHVIRVRLEGEQFLLQATNAETVIAWIEGLQSAANVALDLDHRLMPAAPMLPRRRRRRIVVVDRNS